MKEDTFHDVLTLLEEVRRDLPQGAASRAAEDLDRVIARLWKAHEAGEIGRLSGREVLKQFSDCLGKLAPIVSLAETVLKSL